MIFDAERARSYLAERVAVDAESGCWVWKNSVGSHGYGNAFVGGKVGTAHRAAHRAFKGPIPEGYEVDHLCRNRRCINPEHLEAVPKAVNIRRQYGYSDDLTKCPHGHDPALRYVDGRGHNACRDCNRQRSRAHRAAHR